MVVSLLLNLGGCVVELVSHNKRQQSDLVKLSPFLQKAAKMPPSCPSRCGGRYVHPSLRNIFVEISGIKKCGVQGGFVVEWLKLVFCFRPVSFIIGGTTLVQFAVPVPKV